MKAGYFGPASGPAMDVGVNLWAIESFAETLSRARITSYTYGAPRVGNARFREVSIFFSLALDANVYARRW